MISILIAAALALILSLVATPLFARYLRRRGLGQFIREDGPTTHHTKRGTPTMGGVVILGSVLIAYFAIHLTLMPSGISRGPTISGLLVLLAAVGMGVVGFLDDSIKMSKERSLGLSARGKIIGQGVVGVAFGIFGDQLSQ